ncbi:FAD-binding oxidoreductase [Cobetia sp. MMG027]|uniref:NAD(P)/FAD-dependent oxidoreductase n=1 Tax=Cobetia sp. MMG027 TaxID=3021980 RepID=UPI0022FE19EE|nr:FAD-binding oxidoreductase [Cobetia sp. MMG027]MDA5562347.1 FAD-binding oxidoreductase [Cobetia sp. MMG027]
MTKTILPQDDGSNGWYHQLETRFDANELKHDKQVDWLVIGAGFTGLAAARRLGELRPDSSVVLLEALRVGQGASGRNSGFVIDLPHKRDLEGHDDARKQHQLKLNRQAIADLGHHVERFGIECGWSIEGKYQGAVGERGLAFLTHYEQCLKALDYPYERLDREALATRLGTRHYASAIYTAGGALMQPAALVRGLADSLPANVTLHEQTPVTSLTREAGGWIATTQAGSVRAKKVILASNIYSGQFGFLRNRMLPVMTFASMTRPLTHAERRGFLNRQWGLTPADHAGTTLRMTDDFRLMVRNQYRYVPKYHDDLNEREAIRQGHRESFLARYPQLAHVPFESTWGGACGLSTNFEPWFGKVADGAWMTGIHQSVGVGRGTISGRLLAEMALGEDSELLSSMLAITGKPGRNPPQPFLGVGVRARMRHAAWASRSEF